MILPVTFVIPVGEYHIHLVDRAVESVYKQTIPCECIVVYDQNHRGAGWARNRGLEQVETPFTVFLDADDYVDAGFVEECLIAYDGTRYIFTDWIAAKYVEAPECPWKGDGSFHVVTCLLPTQRILSLGGFDEELPGGEDSSFFWKITRAGLCGARLPKALFTYTADGQRGHQHVNSPNYHSIMQRAIAPYQELPMGCCVDGVIRDESAPGQPQAGDVLAQILWNGPRTKVGRQTGRLYTRLANSRQMWVNPTDIDADPQNFARVVEMPQPMDRDELARFKAFTHDALDLRGASAAAMPPAATGDAPAVPNVACVIELYKNRQHGLTSQDE